MAKMLKHFRRKKSKADEFQITASVSSLTIECVKEKWHPTKLVVVWDREKPKLCCTKPVRWQSGIKNPYRGTHVWPVPDPVKTTISLFTNSGKELLQYKEKPWTILVQNLSLSGRRKIIATGQIDIADYVSEEPSTHDVTVTLRPATKNVVTGSLEFSLSSVLLEDGIPRRTDKEIFDEIMQDAIRSRKQSLRKATTSKSSTGSLQTSSEHKAVVSDTDVEEKKSPASPLSGDNKVYDPQEGASCSNNKNTAPKTVKRKAPAPPLLPKSRPAPPPPLPRKSRPAPAPPLRTKSRPAPPPPLPAKCRPTPPQSRPPRPPPPSQSKRGVKGSSLNRTEETIANGRKRYGGTKEKTKYPTELNPFGGTSESEESCFDGDTSPRATSSKKTLTGVLGQEPGNQDEVKTSSSRRKRNRRKKKKGNKYPKELNPFDEHDSLSSESESNSCKETPEKDSEVIDGPGRCKELDQGDGKVTGTSNDNAIVSKNASSDVRESGAVALKTPLIHSQLAEANREESSERQLEHDDRGSTPNELVSSVGVEELSEAKEGEATKFEETKGEETERVKSHCRIFDEPVLKRAKPYVAVEELSEANGEETSNAKKGDDGPCGTTNELVLQSGKQQERVNGHCSTHDEPLLKRAKPYVPTAFDKMDDKDEESSEGKRDGHCSTLELRTSPTDAANSDMSCSILPVDVSTYDRETAVHEEKASPEMADGDTSSSGQQEKATPDKADPDTPSSALQEKATPDEADPDAPSSALQKEATPDKADTDIPSSAQQEKATPDKADPDTPSSALQKEATPDKADTDIPSSAQQEKATPDKADTNTPSSVLQKEATPDKADTDNPSSAQLEKATPVTADSDIPSTAQQEKATPEKADPGTPSSGNIAGCSHVPEKGFIQASDPIHANRHENDKAASLVSQPCPELSRYAKEQICLLQEEIASLDKVSIKLQMELLQAMEMKDCEEELDGLTQDWLSITKYRGELIERKQDLEILVEQHNFDKCCNIIRNELKFLLELEGWRKTDEHRVQQQELLKILLSFNNKRVSISQLH